MPPFQWAHSIRPDSVVLLELDLKASGPFFLPRVQECLDFHASLFDCHDCVAEQTPCMPIVAAKCEPPAPARPKPANAAATATHAAATAASTGPTTAAAAPTAVAPAATAQVAVFTSTAVATASDPTTHPPSTLAASALLGAAVRKDETPRKNVVTAGDLERIVTRNGQCKSASRNPVNELSESRFSAEADRPLILSGAAASSSHKGTGEHRFVAPQKPSGRHEGTGEHKLTSKAAPDAATAAVMRSLVSPASVRRSYMLMFEGMFFGRNILNIVASEGLDRMIRPDSLPNWRSRLQRLAFLPDSSMEAVREKVQRVVEKFHGGFGLRNAAESVLLTWQGKPLLAASVWSVDSRLYV